MSATKAVRRRHWYLTAWCTVCGKEERCRIYGKRPKDPLKRVRRVYCGCLNSQWG